MLPLSSKSPSVLSKVLAQVHQHAHLVQRIGGVSIGREDVGHGRSTHLALGRIHHVGLQVAHAALAGTFHPDALFAAGGLVELVHQLVEAFQLVTIVIGPHGDMGHPGGAAGFSGALRCAAAGCTAQCQRRSAQQTDECSNVLFHRNALLAFPQRHPLLLIRLTIPRFPGRCKPSVPKSYQNRHIHNNPAQVSGIIFTFFRQQKAAGQETFSCPAAFFF